MGNSQKKNDFEQRLIGTVVPVGALRGERSLGVGEFPDLTEFAALCTRMGIGLIQLLPVNDTGYESSPYFALTAFALHPLYLRIGDLSEATRHTRELEQLGRQFNKEARFPYQQILRAKMKLLREIYAAHEKDIAGRAKSGASLGIWIQNHPWVKEYAVFRRLKEANEERSWKEWPNYGRVVAQDIDALWNDEQFRSEHLFWVWLQEALDKQFSLVAKSIADMGIILEGDLPILMNEDSCDVWAHSEYFHGELSAGAPPDMYSPDGQNWGFPTYNWEAHSKDNYSWWKNRLKTAEQYYRAYRIDHVLGFFRIWASGREHVSAAMGRFIPSLPVNQKDFEDLGFDQGRVRWISQPHIPTGEVWDSLREKWGGEYREADIGAEAQRVFTQALDRVGNEELWLFKDAIRGEKDIHALNLHPAATAYLLKAWSNRIFQEYEEGLYSPVWYYRFSRAYASLSENERTRLEALLEKRRIDSERIWASQGKQLLSVLAASSSMLPCAEDLGAVPDCVPKVLTKLKILGLRVVRWFREWEDEGEPYIPLSAYPELSVCTPAVHDSSTLREWWDREADQKLFAGFIGVPSLPKVFNPGTAKIILYKIAGAKSRFRVFQIQDLLHLSHRWYAPDPASERINVPGTYNEFNWTYRLPAPIAELAKDEDLIKSIKELGSVKPAK
ncbi:MAG: 4-alpha-glucanotransferase [Treponema sp.]|jgi:4-alpha-glucanotransferase|nr:4-alpha-glucanotransferase [Treponema sp.]